MLSKLRNVLKDCFCNFLLRSLLCIYIPHSEHLGFYDCFLWERSKGMRIRLSKPKQRNLGKNGLVENIQQGDEQRDAHKPDDGCSDWMLCSVTCMGILAVTTVNLLSQFFKNVLKTGYF